MTWDSGNWDSSFWDASPASSYFLSKPKSKTPKNMRRQVYYPSRIGDQVNWLDNFSVKLPIYATTLGVSAPDLAAAVNDAKWGNYLLGTWLSAVRAFSPSTTESVDAALTGEGTDDVELPGFDAPALPAGVTAPAPGLLTRLFALIARLKLSAAMTDAIGTDLGILGPEDVDNHPTPRFSTEVVQGSGQQGVNMTFYKYSHQGVHIESRRGAGGAWEFLAIDTESPYLDDRPLLTAGQPEVREFRMRFWDKGTPNGDWTDVQKVTVSP